MEEQSPEVFTMPLTHHPSTSRSHEDPRSTRPDLRPRLMALLVGVLDARHNHLDYFDTIGGDELRRLYRERRRAAGGGTNDLPEQDQTVQTRRHDRS